MSVLNRITLDFPRSLGEPKPPKRRIVVEIGLLSSV